MKYPFAQFLILILVFLLFALPFKAMSLIPAFPGFTDVRPVAAALGPIYAIFFGPIGCLAMACGNLIADVMDHALHWSSLAGFSANFFGPFSIWFFWNRFAKSTFALRTIPQLLTHIALLLMAAILETAIITSAVTNANPEIDASLFACRVMFDSSIFPIFMGIPMIMLMQEELGYCPLMNLTAQTTGNAEKNTSH